MGMADPLDSISIEMKDRIRKFEREEIIKELEKEIKEHQEQGVYSRGSPSVHRAIDIIKARGRPKRIEKFNSGHIEVSSGLERTMMETINKLIDAVNELREKNP